MGDGSYHWKAALQIFLLDDLAKSKWDHWPEEAKENDFKTPKLTGFLVCSNSSPQLCSEEVKDAVPLDGDIAPKVLANLGRN